MTLGQCLKLMTLNGLGFTSRPLDLEAQFFASRPWGRDCGTTINDDRLGRALDRFYDFGCDRLFAALAAKAAMRYEFHRNFAISTPTVCTYMDNMRVKKISRLLPLVIRKFKDLTARALLKKSDFQTNQDYPWRFSSSRFSSFDSSSGILSNLLLFERLVFLSRTWDHRVLSS